jgi:hypothetical protein
MKAASYHFILVTEHNYHSQLLTSNSSETIFIFFQQQMVMHTCDEIVYSSDDGISST